MQRLLSNEELLHVRRKLHDQDWDNGLIEQFMDEKDTNAYSIQINNDRIVNIFTKDTHSQSINRTASEVDRILSWLGAPQKFTVNLWLIDKPRSIDAHEWPSRTSVNGGWTQQESNEVFIYRKEEWDRVLIHEMIHALGWDWQMPTNPLPCWKFKDTDVLYPHLFEAWTELYAEWLWCGWKNISWKAQRKWQDEQAIQILARRNIRNEWKEDTNVFAYYVLKAALAPHMEFLWVFRNGTNTEEKLYVLCELIQPHMRKLEEKAYTIKPKKISMRMTIKN